jgi:hypothetical protein
MRSTPHRSFPWHTWLGIAWLIACEALLWSGNRFVATWFTPLMWTGYILTIDAVVSYRRGVSWLTTRRRELPLLLLLSVAVWVLFEAYNFHLRNWYYVNVPANAWLRWIAFFWSFATIMPGVFESADLARSFLPARRSLPQAVAPRASTLAVSFVIGVALVTVPLAVPAPTAAYLFGAVWIGFILLLEPVLELLGIDGVFRGWRQGEWQTALSLLLGGLACGLLWEAWNYQAVLHDGGHWIYTVPEALRVSGLHYGKMPLLGLGGFPPFAVELQAFYLVLRSLLGGTRIFGGPQTRLLTTS